MKKRITILVLHLGYGGIEKCVSSLATELSNDYEVEIISTYKLFEKPFFYIPSNVKIKYLITDLKPKKDEFISNLKKLKFISCFGLGLTNLKVLYQKKKKMIEAIKKIDSDVIISTRDIHNKWLGKYGKKEILKIGWEHNHHNNNKKYIKKIVKSVENLNYFVLVSKELKEFYEKLVKPDCIYIPNAIDEYPMQCSRLNQKKIISVGRLSKEKGFLDLIDVFELVIKKYPDWILNIVGDGSEKKAIEDKIIKKNLTKNINLLGYQKKEVINSLYQESSIYVLPSYIESFGIVLIEAYSYGIPAVAFRTAKGATEIISNNWDGYLIDDRDKIKMAKKICELIKNKNRRIIMGHNARKKSENYSINIIIQKWIEIIEK